MGTHTNGANLLQVTNAHLLFLEKNIWFLPGSPVKHFWAVMAENNLEEEPIPDPRQSLFRRGGGSSCCCNAGEGYMDILQVRVKGRQESMQRSLS